MKKLLKRLRMVLLLSLTHKLRNCGKDSYIGSGVVIRPNTLWLGSESFVGPRCWLAVDDLRIGNFVMLAGRVAIVGGDHRFNSVGTPIIRSGSDRSRPVVIEDDVWIGHGVTILHGVAIGEGSVIGASSIVTKDIPPYSIAVGSPALPIRMRFTTEEIEAHRRALSKIRTQLGYNRVSGKS